MINHVRKEAFEVLQCRYMKPVGVNLEERTRAGNDNLSLRREDIDVLQ
jgi:hypothetical protein